jgi:acylphosphatase
LDLASINQSPKDHSHQQPACQVTVSPLLVPYLKLKGILANMLRFHLLALLLLQWSMQTVSSFQVATMAVSHHRIAATPMRPSSQSSRLQLSDAPAEADDDEYIAKRIIVEGDVHGYYRSCVRNEASRFRSLVGSMSDPDDTSKQAEIYVEGTRKMVDGFLRWVRRGNAAGLSQIVEVLEVIEEDPTGLYESFYVKTK